MEIAEAQEFLKHNHHGVLVARKKDGSLQMTLVSPVIGRDGKVVITARETTFKVKNIRRNPQVSLLVYGDRSTVQTIFRSMAKPKCFPIHKRWISYWIGTGRSAASRQVGTRCARRRWLKDASPFS